MLRRRGFTLIELLVVIAIIGILAAMLFPVFARARESARKTQCLANVKNVAIAINMYLTDYDRFWPGFHDDYAQSWWDNHKAKSTAKTPCSQAKHANPYLQVAVILDDYTKNRDIWRCPSAKLMEGAGLIIPSGRNGYWLNVWVDNAGTWESDRPVGPCYTAWPPGWGGDITDSFGQGLVMAQTQAQGSTSAANGVFVQGVGTNDDLKDKSTSQVSDAARWVVCGDTGKHVEFWETEGIALADTCAANGCGGLTYMDSNGGDPCPDTCATADWVNCSDSQSCGLTAEAHHKLLTDSNYLKGFTRHLGGANVGFADGHAKWSPAQTLLTGAEPFKDPQFLGICSCWPGNDLCR